MPTENQTDLLDGDLLHLAIKTRKKLVPLWIKIFSWIFIVFSFLVPVAILFAIMGSNFSMSLYALETNDPFSITGICLILVYIFKGIVAYNILKEKDLAIKLAIIDAVAGIFICVLVMLLPDLLPEGNGNFSFRLELLFLIPYLVKMLKIKPEWEGNVQLQ